MNTFYLILLSMRPKQWVKNLFIFPALMFSQNLFNLKMTLLSITAFVIFCILSGSIYLLNDLLDVEEDRKHPLKSYRPIASGRLNPRVVKPVMGIMSLVSLGAAFFLNHPFGMVAIAYFIIHIAYSLHLKKIVILDVFSIASGFFLRVIAGAEAISVPISSWLLICTLFISLFLALGKRRHELLLLGENAGQHRKVLEDYSVGLLDQMVNVVTAGTVLSYSLYTLSSETLEKFHTSNLWLTIPIVLFGIFRYLYRVYRKEEGGSPEEILLRDRSFLASIILYILVVMVVLYF